MLLKDFSKLNPKLFLIPLPAELAFKMLNKEIGQSLNFLPLSA